uniref:GTP:AMP phosphotransferase, mitochondrial n=1 Tax=Ciona intestinalis TaxID=7719 RepID=F6PR96_CIOIN|nr:GTP:AMP phosphotransferase AK3, mitochondrial isoform X2 [Ciona intestinalis]|eukprot:XP_026690497.1 GTP:AMP phosphotransferase AK3, mitochondrial isoform X2 [Ciona intestinalis]
MRLTLLRKAIHAIIMGPPGSGKGTVSARIIRDFDMQHLSSGDMLRAEIAEQSTYGTKAKQFIEDGKLVPDALVVELVLSQIQKIPTSTSWLLDGFPRTIEQAETLSTKEKIDCVINLDVPFETIRERLSGRWTHLSSGRVYNDGFNPPKIPGVDDLTGEPLVQRDDDKPETVQKRLETYQLQTAPLLDFYREKGLLHSYSGTKTDEIWPKVKEFLSTTIMPHVNRSRL